MQRTRWTTDHVIDELREQIADAQKQYRGRLDAFRANAPTELAAYHRFLSFHYHLSHAAYGAFVRVADCPRISELPRFRRFLKTFAASQKMHHTATAVDLRALGLSILPRTFDVALWHGSLDTVAEERPFVRIGAAVIMENLPDRIVGRELASARETDISQRENRDLLLVLHLLDTRGSGGRLLEALAEAPLTPQDLSELLLGAKLGTALYLRMIDWALERDAITEANPTSSRAFVMELDDTLRPKGAFVH